MVFWINDSLHKTEMTENVKKNIFFGRVYTNALALLATSLVSLVIIVAGHYTVQREIRELESLTKNEEIKIELNNLLQKRLRQIKMELQAVSLSRSEKETNLHYERGENLLAESDALLDVLENGGTFINRYLVNFGNEEEVSQTLRYQNINKGALQLEIIELKSRLNELHDILAQLHSLIVLRKENGSEKSETKIFFFSKGVQPFFNRILENANRIYFESQQHLVQIRQAKDRVSEKNEGIILTVTLGAVLLLLVAGYLLTRDIRRILKERERSYALINEYNENLEKKVRERTRELEEANQGLKHEVRERKKAENTILEQADFLTNAIEAISHPFYVINVEDFSILPHNSAARELGDADSLTCYQLTHRQDAPCRGNEHPCPLREIVRTGKPCVVEHIHFDRKNNKRFVEVHGYPIFDQHGKLTQMIEYSLDITSKKEAELSLKKINEELESRVEERTRELAGEIATRRKTEQELRKLSRAVEQSSSTVVVTDTKGKIEYVNQGFSRATGYSAEEAIGQNPSILASGKTPEHVYKEMWQTISHGDTWTGEFVNKKKNGELYEENVIISPIRNDEGEISHYIAIKEDISELKKAWKVADEANRAKSFFLANMSHEIRTPMNGIIGMTRLALESDPEPRMRHFLKTIQSASDNLLQLINDILDFSKIEARQLELENHPFSPGQLMKTTVQTIDVLASEKELKVTMDIHPDVPEAVKGDSFRLGQILLNLLSNAVKFTEKGGVAIQVERQPDHADQVWLNFAVQDTGKGISPDKLEHIFDHFSQEDSSVTRKYGGTGLGLAICRKLSRLMGGGIQVRSAVGQGSSFSVTLPFQPADSQEKTVKTTGSDAIPQSIAPLHLLLVEDNLINSELALMTLEKDGHRVTTAENGLEALKSLADHHFDAILMDVQMPVMDGLTCSRMIRSLERNDAPEIELPAELQTRLEKSLSGRSTPIVAMTAHAMSGDRERCLQAGMDCYLTKPFEPEKVTAALNQFAADSSPHVQSPPGKSPVEAASASTPSGDNLLVKARTHLRTKFNFAPEQLDQILTASAKSFDKHLDRLELAVSQADHDSLAAASHAIKGSLLNLGIKAEAELARKIELAAGSREQVPYDEYFQKLRKSLEDFSFSEPTDS